MGVLLYLCLKKYKVVENMKTPYINLIKDYSQCGY